VNISAWQTTEPRCIQLKAQEQNFGNKHWPGTVRGRLRYKTGNGSSRNLSQRHTKVRATIDAGKFWYLKQGRALRWHQQSSDVQTGGEINARRKKSPRLAGAILNYRSNASQFHPVLGSSDCLL